MNIIVNELTLLIINIMTSPFLLVVVSYKFTTYQDARRVRLETRRRS